MRTTNNQAGVMLIEALIGILIFSIGILALLGMQGTAIKNTTDARYRSEAAYLATQIVGQMWVDMDKLDSYKTDGTGPAIFPPRDNWVNAVAGTLPGVEVGGPRSPSIQVGPDAGAGLVEREVRVTVQWQHPGNENETRQVIILNHIHAGIGI
jgi:type IV pilus assembly protein PilV